MESVTIVGQPQQEADHRGGAERTEAAIEVSVVDANGEVLINTPFNLHSLGENVYRRVYEVLPDTWNPVLMWSAQSLRLTRSDPYGKSRELHPNLDLASHMKGESGTQRLVFLAERNLHSEEKHHRNALREQACEEFMRRRGTTLGSCMLILTASVPFILALAGNLVAEGCGGGVPNGAKAILAIASVNLFAHLVVVISWWCLCNENDQYGVGAGAFICVPFPLWLCAQLATFIVLVVIATGGMSFAGLDENCSGAAFSLHVAYVWKFVVIALHMAGVLFLGCVFAMRGTVGQYLLDSTFGTRT